MAKSTKPKPPEARKPLGVVAKQVHNYLATHHVKLFSTDVLWKQRILDVEVVNGRPNATKAVCSTTIDGNFALTLAIGATGANLANALTLELDGRPANALHYARNGDAESLRKLKFSKKEVEILLAEVKSLKPVYPDTVDPSQKQVFFETETDCILVTPSVSAKVFAEIHRRLRKLADAWQGQGKPSPKRDYVPVSMNAHFGGSNPQNAGASLGKSSRVSSRNSVSLLLANPPQDRRSPTARMLARIGARGSYDAAVNIEPEELVTYATRAMTSIELRSLIDAETRQADELAEAYLGPAVAIRKFVAARERLGSTPPYDKLSKDELAFLDSRNGAFDAETLADLFTKALARRIGWAARRKNEAGQHVQYLLPDRSFLNLRSAFGRALA